MPFQKPYQANLLFIMLHAIWSHLHCRAIIMALPDRHEEMRDFSWKTSIPNRSPSTRYSGMCLPRENNMVDIVPNVGHAYVKGKRGAQLKATWARSQSRWALELTTIWSSRMVQRREIETGKSTSLQNWSWLYARFGENTLPNDQLERRSSLSFL